MERALAKAKRLDDLSHQLLDTLNRGHRDAAMSKLREIYQAP